MKNTQFIFGVFFYTILAISLTFNIVYYVAITPEINVFNENAPDGIYVVYYFSQDYVRYYENNVFLGYCNPNTELLGNWKIIPETFNSGFGYYKVVVIDNIIVHTIKME